MSAPDQDLWSAVLAFEDTTNRIERLAHVARCLGDSGYVEERTRLLFDAIADALDELRGASVQHQDTFAALSGKYRMQ